MTTVCWDGNTLAADTLYVSGTRRMQGDYEKILMPDEVQWTVEGQPILAVGFSGTIATIPKIKAALAANATPGLDPDVGDAGFSLLMVTDKKVLYYWNYGLTAKSEVVNELFVLEGNHAVGSGSIYGLGVMAIRGDAISAVKAGIRVDVNSGGYIDVWSFETPRLLTRVNPTTGEIVSAKQNTPVPEKSDAILCAVNG